MKKMQALQPKIKALQEQHKNDQAKISREMMELYKRHKVNPMGGCLPMVLQIPVFIAFYQVLAQTAELQGEPFIFWVKDLSGPDRAWTFPFQIPFLGDSVNILPILMIGSMVWQQQLTPHTGTPEQQKVMMIMPLVMGVILYQLPSGLVLYWFVSNLLSIIHQLFVKGKSLPHHE
jgi:YidC/Oxa1 family membrane protein insertase